MTVCTDDRGSFHSVRLFSRDFYKHHSNEGTERTTDSKAGPCRELVGNKFYNLKLVESKKVSKI